MRSREEILQKKWQRLLQHRRFFHLIPFIDFVLVSGSMALGTAREESDFDVIVGARAGRIFTVRFFCVSVFELLGLRRKRADYKGKIEDKLCFNHFVGPIGYTLAPPYNSYWRALYCNLVPIYGDRKTIEIFLRANKWAGQIGDINDSRRLEKKRSIVGAFLEGIFGGRLGNWLESVLKRYQIKRIVKYSGDGLLGNMPRLLYTDDVIEFHTMEKRLEL